jgi:WD40 repeat protein
VLVVDQFEELFTMTDEASRALFIDSIVNAVTDPRNQIRVVATLRADFFDRPLHHPELGRLVDEGLVNVIPLNPTELQQAITGPANRIGVEVDSDLVGRMIADVAERPGALPLLQYVLTEVFDARDGHRMTLAAYGAIGGINGALGGRAEEVFAALTHPVREATRQLFLRLVTIDAAVQETRNRVSRRSLSTIADGAAMSRAIDAFAGARLVAFDADPVSGLPTVQVAHEAIFRAWPRLEEWIDATRSARHAQRRLGTAVTDWIEHDRDADYLASGRRLAEFESLDADGQLALIPLEREYVAASRHREDAARRTRSRRRRAVTATLLIAFVIAGAFAIFAVVQRRSAEAEARTALARELTAASVAALDLDPELSILLALEAVTVTSTTDGIVLVQAEEALRLAVLENRLIRTIPNTTVGVFDPDGTHYAAGDEAGDVRLWDLSTNAVEQLPEPHRGRVTAVAFGPDGHVVISGGLDAAVKVWNTTTGTVRTLDGHRDAVVDIAISRNGQQLATTSGDGTARIWALASDAAEEPWIEPNATAAVAFDPGRPRLAVIDPFDREVRLVDTGTRETVGTLLHLFPVTDLEYLPDGSLLATAMEDGTVTIWDAETLTLAGSYGARSLDLAVNRQGDRLATAGEDGVVKVWDTTTGTETLRLAGHRGQVTSLSFDAAGIRLASAGVDGTARIWDVSPEGNREAASLIGMADPRRVVFSGDSRFLAATGTDDAGSSRTMIWDTGSWKLLHDLPGTASVALSPDGSMFATIDERRLVTVRDMDGDVLVEPMQEGTSVAPDLVTAVAFTPDGARIITGDEVGSVQVWEADFSRLVVTMPGSHFRAVVGFEIDASGRYFLSYGEPFNEAAFIWNMTSAQKVSVLTPPELGVTIGLTSAALSSDGTVVLTGGRDGVTRAWDALTAAALDAPFLVGSGTVRGIAYSPDGQRIATASDDGTVRLWDATTDELLMRWPAHNGGATDVSFSSDGRFLVSTGGDGTVRVYLAEVDDLIDLARSRVTRTLTDDECRRFLHVKECPET